jgi:hypothetical protein
MELQEMNSIKGNPMQFKSLTSLLPEEFDELLPYFSRVSEKYFIHHDLKGEKRAYARRVERKDSSLFGSEMKLLFLLIYLKENANQHYHAVIFRMSQGKVSQWLGVLRPLLKETLKNMGQLSCRWQEELKKLLGNKPEEVLLMDCSERTIQRPKDYQVQKDYYSGKKGRHTIKNLAITNPEGRILYLSPTYEGHEHDKAIYDQQEIIFPDQDSALIVDLGFPGIKAENVSVWMPAKKPKKGVLSQEQKELNRFISSIRVKIEHAFSGVKRLKIVRDTIRLHGHTAKDEMMEIAVGLHNFRTSKRAA